MNDFAIVKEKVATSFIAADGNIHQNTDGERFVLKNVDDETISHQYYCMFPLGDDHFAVCDLICHALFYGDYNEYDIIKGEYEASAPKMKWGVIRVNRDDSGKIIPGAETMVVPYLYDRISSNNMRTATVEKDNGFSYLDLDINSSTYGQQLVPCVLTHAAPFSTEYTGFAECSVNGVVGYLPRNCRVRERIEGAVLLTEDQVSNLTKFSNDLGDHFFDGKAIFAYFNLTGEVVGQEDAVQYKKSIDEEGR